MNARGCGEMGTVNREQAADVGLVPSDEQRAGEGRVGRSPAERLTHGQWGGAAGAGTTHQRCPSRAPHPAHIPLP